MKLTKIIKILPAILMLAMYCSVSDIPRDNELDPSADNFTVTENADLQDVNTDAANLSFSNFTFGAGDSEISVTQNFSVPIYGDSGTSISWESDDSSIVFVNGTALITRPTTGIDKTVTITATITKGSESAITTFDIEIKATADTVPPSGVTDLTVTPAERSVTLDWLNPTTDYAGAKVVRKSGSYPANADDGIDVCQGDINTCLDTYENFCDLAYYSVFAYDLAGNFSIAANILGIDSTCFSQQGYLIAPNAGASDYFGRDVSISGDTIVVGAYGEDSSQITITNGSTASADNSATDAGAAYVFVRSGTTWSQQAYLKAPNAGAGDGFGTSVSISGDTIVVGASTEDSSQTTITNDATASADNSTSSAGAAYVFVRSGATWSQQAYLKAPNAEVFDRFGTSVSISGDTIVVGALDEESSQTTITNDATASADNSASSAGAAYVFVRSGTTWSHQAYLKVSNAEADDKFGVSVSISGDTIVAGANYEDSSQTTITNGSTGSDDNSATDAGAAYVFVRSGTTWSQQAYLKAPNAEASDYFGNSVSISGDTIVVGAYYEDSDQTTITNGSTASSDNSASAAGAAYVFVRSGTTWSHQAYLKAPNAEASDYFGCSVSISGDTIVVGAHSEDSGEKLISNGSTASADNSAGGSGAAYVFVRNSTNGTWRQNAYLKGNSLVGSFGGSVFISGDTVVVGSSGYAGYTGTAYAFVRQ
ncbi:MAG: hypothetical protein OEZ13_03805 [Spirochaetia bacterium]|nr:hypothetical protein [Spirochaetia bacterium]